MFLIIVAIRSFSFAYYWPILTAIDDNYLYGQSNKEQAVAAGALGILNDVVLWYVILLTLTLSSIVSILFLFILVSRKSECFTN